MPTLKEKSLASPTALTVSAESPGPAKISAEELHALLNGADKAAVTVIDVRPAEEYTAFHIPGSVNKPFQEMNFAQLIADSTQHAYQEGSVFIFVSAQSPDVDDLAAREYMNEYSKTHQNPPGDGAVSILLGGVCNWSEKYPA